MTQLLPHTVAHSTRPSFRPKINNQPSKKFLSLEITWVKSLQNVQNSDFQSQFSKSKMIQIFLNKIFVEEYFLRSSFFVIDIFWQLQLFYFLKWCPIFDDFYKNARVRYVSTSVFWITIKSTKFFNN